MLYLYYCRFRMIPLFMFFSFSLFFLTKPQAENSLNEPLVLFVSEDFPCITLHHPQKEEGWEFLGEKNEVKIYIRQRADSKIKEGLGIGKVNAHPCLVFQVVTNPDYFIGLFPYVSGIYITKVVDHTHYSCQYLDFPWPIGDRKVNIIDTWKLFGAERYCEFLSVWKRSEIYRCSDEQFREAYSGYKPEAIETPANEGYWHLILADDGLSTICYYYVFVDPGGKIPAWVQNWFVDDSISSVFEAVRKGVKFPERYSPCDCQGIKWKKLEKVGVPGKE